MKHIIIALVGIFLLAAAGSSEAALARTDINQMDVEVYGIYTTDDPTCQSGLKATVPLSTTPFTFDMTQSPTMGTGPVPDNTIKCVVMVMKNSMTFGWTAGNYTGTSNGASDSACNAGGSSSQKICRGVNSLAWPAQIQTDAAAIGLTLGGSCPATPDGTEVVPTYLSTYSLCTGNQVSDAAITGCAWINGNPLNDPFSAPASAGDTAHGITISAPSSASTYYFVVDPDQTIGGSSSDGCSSVAPPKFGFR